MKNNFAEKFTEERVLSFALFFSLIYILIRNSGLYPSVVDEVVYSTNARLMPIENTLVPDYLYRWIFSLTTVCVDGWLNCARLLNAILYIAGVILVYSVGRKFLSARYSAYLAIATAVGVTNTYTAYFMPEATYFLLFWLLSWFILKWSRVKNELPVIAVGFTCGLLSLVKPHAIFLIPAICLFGLYVARKSGFSYFHWLRSYVFLFLLSFSLTKFGIGYIFDGVNSLTLLGKSYSAIGDAITAKGVRYGELLENIFLFSFGHIFALALIYAVPILNAVRAFRLDNLGFQDERMDLAVYSFLVVFSLVVVASVFTAGYDGSEGPMRIHLRYYSFSLPLLMMVGLSQFTAPEESSKKSLFDLIIAVVLIAVIVFFYFGAIKNYSPNYVDGPEIRGATGAKITYFIVTASACAAVVLWLVKQGLGSRFYFFCFFPVYIVLSNIQVTSELRNRMYLTPYDKAAIVSRNLLQGSGETSRLTLVGPAEALGVLVLSKSYLDNPNVSTLTLPVDSVIRRADLPPETKWIAFTGNYSVEGGIKWSFVGDGFTVARLAGEEIINLSAAAWPGVVSYTRGLGAGESWGRWTWGKVVVLSFIDPLPPRFELQIVASPYGPNMGKDFVVRVGDSVQSFVLTANDQRKIMQFTNPVGSRELVIEIPSPTPISDGGEGLGMMLTEIRVKPTPL